MQSIHNADHNKAPSKSLFTKGLKDGLPICLGYLSVSFVFGMMCTENGLHPLWALLISGTNLTSAGQFAGTEILLAGGALVELAVTTLVINIRYMLMSLSLSQKLDLPLWQRAIVAFGNTDEIFAVSIQQTHPLTFAYMLGLILTPYVGWTSGTILGATMTGLMPLSVRSAMGIAIYGMFIAIIIPPARSSRSVMFTCICAAALSCLFAYTPGLNTLGSGWSIILCAILAAGAAAFFFPLREDNAASPDADPAAKEDAAP